MSRTDYAEGWSQPIAFRIDECAELFSHDIFASDEVRQLVAALTTRGRAATTPTLSFEAAVADALALFAPACAIKEDQ